MQIKTKENPELPGLLLLFIMRPHSQNTDYLFFFKHHVYKMMMDIDPSRICPQ